MDINLERLKNAMLLQTQKNDVTANNLANINTIGFKREHTFLQSLEDETRNTLASQTVHDQGQLKQTDNPLDLAISGRGFFTVQTQSGQAYTRDGHLAVDEYGALRTTAGHLLMGAGGPLVVSQDGLKTGSVRISQHGEIFVDDDYVDRLQVVDFDNLENLQRIGTNLYVNNADPQPDVLEEPVILQGNLETSNVDPVQEMIHMIELQRHFESSQRVLTNYDRMLGKAANDISRYQ